MYIKDKVLYYHLVKAFYQVKSPPDLQKVSQFYLHQLLVLLAQPLHDLRREALRPRTRIRDPADEWSVQQALACGFVAPTDPELFKVAVRYRYPRGSSSRARHMNAKDLGVVEKAARWATRRPELRGRRLIVQTDSAVAAGALRKGRSSKRALKGIARRLAAVCIAERLELVARWVPTDRNMADRPSRDHAAAAQQLLFGHPGRDRGHDLIAVDQTTIGVDSEEPVRVTVECDAEIGAALDDSGLQRFWMGGPAPVVDVGAVGSGMEHRHVGTEAHGHARRVRPYHAAADHHHA